MKNERIASWFGQLDQKILALWHLLKSKSFILITEDKSVAGVRAYYMEHFVEHLERNLDFAKGALERIKEEDTMS